MIEQNFEQLRVYQEARKLVNLIYVLSKRLPKEETYGLVTQIRRAALSIMLNIAEGQGRKTKKDHKQFLLIARGSAYEVIAILQICLDQGIINQQIYQELRQLLSSVLGQINNLIGYLDR